MKVLAYVTQAKSHANWWQNQYVTGVRLQTPGSFDLTKEIEKAYVFDSPQVALTFLQESSKSFGQYQKDWQIQYAMVPVEVTPPPPPPPPPAPTIRRLI